MRRLVDDDVANRAAPCRPPRPGEPLPDDDDVEELTSRISSSDIPATLDQLGVQVHRHASRRRASAYPIDVRAGDEHDLGRRRRAAARADGRRRPAQDDRRVHPGHQPGRPRRVGPGPGGHGLQLGPAPRPVALRDVRALPPDLLPARRGAVGHAVRPPGARPGPHRAAGVRGPPHPSRLEPEGRRPDRAGQPAGLRPDRRRRCARGPQLVANNAAADEVDQLVADSPRQVVEAAEGARASRSPTRAGRGDAINLLQSPESGPWTEFTAPNSLREVEVGSNLLLREDDPSDDPTRRLPRPPAADDDADERASPQAAEDADA